MADVAIEKKTSQSIKFQPPRKWKVVFFNDDSTPMEYVIDVLMRIFHHDDMTAKEITLSIHNAGRGIAGVYPYEIAEQKSAETIADSRHAGFGLQVDLEQE